ncbi:hypothetical protein D9M68_744610 [compost metagenome]
MPQFDVLLQDRHIHGRRDVQCQGAHHRAAEDAAEHGDECQDRQGDQQGEHPRQHQQLDRAEAEGADRVDLLVGLHRADLRGKGAGRAPGHEDGGQQHTELAQEGEGHQVDRINAGAEVGEDGRTEKGHHRADQEGQQGDDGHCVEPALLQVRDQRGDAPAPRAQQDGQHRAEGQADKPEQRHALPPQALHRLADMPENFPAGGYVGRR